MGWPYHFVTLTAEETHQRRLLLDYYSRLAQFSPVVILIILQFYYLVRFLYRRFLSSRENESGPPGSPYVKRQRERAFVFRRPLLVRVAGFWRRVLWWCADPVEFGGYRYGSKGEVVAAGVWFCWLMILCVLQTGQDYLHLTKRFGIVGVSQLPWQYLLAMKSSYSPLLLLTRQSHDTINGLHQHLGRISIIFFHLHAGFYLNFYILSNLLLAKLQQAYVICGLLAITSFTILGATAFVPLRKRFYKLFYLVHITVVTAILPLLYFHVSHIRIYLYQVFVILILNAVLRLTSAKRHTAKLNLVPNTNLVAIDIALPKVSAGRHWDVGRHAYISLASGFSRRALGASNPFTVASIPGVDGGLRFVVRSLEGNTAKLAHAAKTNPGVERVISVEGPYGIRTHSRDLLLYDRILFVAGGVGGTFIAPLYRQLLTDLSPSKGSRRRQNVNFVWMARCMEDVTWSLPVDKREREGFVERLRVCLTRNVQGSLSDVSSMSLRDENVVEDESEAGEGRDGRGQSIEMEESRRLLSGNGKDEQLEEQRQKVHDSLQVYAGRPDLSRMVDEVFSSTGRRSRDRVAVFVCGPKELSKGIRREVTRWVRKGRDVWFWGESFSL